MSSWAEGEGDGVSVGAVGGGVGWHGQVLRGGGSGGSGDTCKGSVGRDDIGVLEDGGKSRLLLQGPDLRWMGLQVRVVRVGTHEKQSRSRVWYGLGYLAAGLQLSAPLSGIKALNYWRRCGVE